MYGDTITNPDLLRPAVKPAPPSPSGRFAVAVLAAFRHCTTHPATERNFDDLLASMDRLVVNVSDDVLAGAAVDVVTAAIPQFISSLVAALSAQSEN